MTTQQADSIILESEYADMVDDYEMMEDGTHVYTLENGLSVTIDQNGYIRDYEVE